MLSFLPLIIVFFVCVLSVFVIARLSCVSLDSFLKSTAFSVCFCVSLTIYQQFLSPAGECVIDLTFLEKDIW